jgi:hypothetical protein
MKKWNKRHSFKTEYFCEKDKVSHCAKQMLLVVFLKIPQLPHESFCEIIVKANIKQKNLRFL